MVHSIFCVRMFTAMHQGDKCMNKFIYDVLSLKDHIVSNILEDDNEDIQKIVETQ